MDDRDLNDLLDHVTASTALVQAVLAHLEFLESVLKESLADPGRDGEIT